MTQKISIQDRMKNKAHEAYCEVEYQIDKIFDKPSHNFSMYKFLKQLGYSGKVVQFMKGLTDNTVYELKNEEECEQLEEAYSIYTNAQKKKIIKMLENIESDIDKFCEEYKPAPRIRKPKTPAQLVKKLPFQKKFAKWESINPEDIIRARMLYTYNTSSKKLTCFESQGLSVKGSRIIGYDKCTEKTLTDLDLLDRLYKGGNIIASKFMEEIPRSKLKEGNNLITKNTLLVKVIR